MAKTQFSDHKHPSSSTHQPSSHFTCAHCGLQVSFTAPGTKNRNHCPHCLWSRHLDLHIGDRKNSCKGEMQPIAVSVDRRGEWSILHRCVACGAIRINRIAGDDHEFQLLSLAAKPLTVPPFPLASEESTPFIPTHHS